MNVAPRNKSTRDADAVPLMTTVGATPGLAAPRFRLSTLLTVTAVICVGLALAKIVSPVLSGLVALVLFVGLVHVLGNVIGTNLRHSSRHVLPLADDEAVPIPGSPHDADVFAPAPRLGQQSQLGRGTVVTVSVGALMGAVVGNWVLWSTRQEATSTPAMMLGLFSCAVLGAFAGFGVCAFLSSVGGAVWQAHQEPNPGDGSTN